MICIEGRRIPLFTDHTTQFAYDICRLEARFRNPTLDSCWEEEGDGQRQHVKEGNDGEDLLGSQLVAL